MKILVPVKRVIDYNVRVQIDASGCGVETHGVKMSLNPFDETAVEEAVRLKGLGVADEIVVVSIGSSAVTETLRTALAMGADRAILISCEVGLEPLGVAKILNAVCAEEKPDLVIAGRQAIDDDSGQVGSMLAAMLGWAQAVGVSKLTFSGPTFEAQCEQADGIRTLHICLPAVITADLHLNTPHYVTLPGIMKAKKKPLNVRELAAFGVDVRPRTQRISLREPPMRQPGPCTDDVVQFAQWLSKAAGVS